MLRLRPVAPLQCVRRHISWDKLSNKTITRLESDIELGDCEFKGRLINRNPRNLEQASLEYKPTGFWFEKSPPTDWNTVALERSSDHLVAYLKNWSGKQLICASTSEPQLKKYFRSPNSRQAAILLGKVLSRRCLQSGYIYAGIDNSIDADAPRSQAFLDAIVSEGVILEEPPEIQPRSNSDV